MSIWTVVASKTGVRKLGSFMRRSGSPAQASTAKLYTPGNRTGRHIIAAAGLQTRDLVSVEDHVPVIWDQGATGSCLAQTGCGMAQTIESVQGMPFVELSRRGLYYPLRARDHIEDEDEGGYVDSMLWAWSNWGIPPEERFPWSQRKINQAPSAPIIFAGDGYRGATYEYITGSTAQREEKVRSALAEGLPVGGTALVGSEFMSHSGSGVFDVETLRPLGGHAFFFAAHGYDGLAQLATPVWRLINSWGLGWGDEGRAWVGRRFFRSCDTLFIVHGWKRSAAQRAQLLAA